MKIKILKLWIWTKLMNQIYVHEIEKLKVSLDTQIKKEVEYCLKVVSAKSLLVCFVSLKESTCETRKKVFCFTFCFTFY